MWKKTNDVEYFGGASQAQTATSKNRHEGKCHQAPEWVDVESDNDDMQLPTVNRYVS